MHKIHDRQIIYYCEYCNKKIDTDWKSDYWKKTVNISDEKVIMLGLGADLDTSRLTTVLAHRECVWNNIPEAYRHLFESLKGDKKIILSNNPDKLFGLIENGITYFISYVKYRNKELFEGVRICVKIPFGIPSSEIICDCGAELTTAAAVASASIKKIFRNRMEVWDGLYIYSTIKGCPSKYKIVNHVKKFTIITEDIKKKFIFVLNDYKKTPEKYKNIFPNFGGD